MRVCSFTQRELCDTGDDATVTLLPSQLSPQVAFGPLLAGEEHKLGLEGRSSHLPPFPPLQQGADPPSRA